MRLNFLQRAIAKREAAREIRKIAHGRRLLQAMLPEAEIVQPRVTGSVVAKAAAAIAAGREMMQRTAPVAALCWETIRSRTKGTAQGLACRTRRTLFACNRAWDRFLRRFW
jgi:hypothetical protein